MVEKVHEHGSLGGHRARPQRPRQLEPLQPADVDDRRAHARGRLRPGAVAADGALRHRRSAATAPRRRAALARGRLRPRLRLRRPLPEHDRAVPLSAPQRPHRRLRRRRGTARARLLREVLEDTLDEVDGRAAVACRIMVDDLCGPGGFGRERDRGGPRARRRAARPLGLRRRRVGERLGHLPVRRGGRAGDVRARPQAADDEAGRRRRPLHLARPDGADGARGRARPRRRRAPVDRGSVPAGEDRGGPLRRHPRVHRLQHLRLRRRHDRRRSAARRTRRWARSGAAAGTPSGYRPAATARRRCWSSVPARQGSRLPRRSAKRGYEVVLAEATRSLGGRVEREARLPGLAAWIRVVDYRRGPARPALRTSRSPSRAGSPPTRSSPTTSRTSPWPPAARWRRDGAGRWHPRGLPLDERRRGSDPDDLLDGAPPGRPRRRPLRRRPLLPGRRPGRAARR